MRKFHPILVTICAALIFLAYHFYQHEHDSYIANHAYEEMVSLDKELNQLQQKANDLHKIKDANTQIINSFNSLTKENFDDDKTNFIALVKQAKYDIKTESALLNIINSTDSNTFKTNRHIIRQQLRVLKYDYAKGVDDFDNEIGDITKKVKDLNDNISNIDSSNVQDLELARLRFISHKLAATITDLNGSFVDRILDDVVEKDKISDKDNDGDE